jgi:hypothetical protein
VSRFALKKSIPRMQKSAHVEVRALGSRSIDKARTAAAKLGIPGAYGSYEEVLAPIKRVQNSLAVSAPPTDPLPACASPRGARGSAAQPSAHSNADEDRLRIQAACLFAIRVASPSRRGACIRTC